MKHKVIDSLVKPIILLEKIDKSFFVIPYNIFISLLVDKTCCLSKQTTTSTTTITAVATRPLRYCSSTKKSKYLQVIPIVFNGYANNICVVLTYILLHSYLHIHTNAHMHVDFHFLIEFTQLQTILSFYEWMEKEKLFSFPAKENIFPELCLLFA